MAGTHTTPLIDMDTPCVSTHQNSNALRKRRGKLIFTVAITMMFLTTAVLSLIASILPRLPGAVDAILSSATTSASSKNSAKEASLNYKYDCNDFLERILSWILATYILYSDDKGISAYQHVRSHIEIEALTLHPLWWHHTTLIATNVTIYADAGRLVRRACNLETLRTSSIASLMENVVLKVVSFPFRFASLSQCKTHELSIQVQFGQDVASTTDKGFRSNNVSNQQCDSTLYDTYSDSSIGPEDDSGISMISSYDSFWSTIFTSFSSPQKTTNKITVAHLPLLTIQTLQVSWSSWKKPVLHLFLDGITVHTTVVEYYNGTFYSNTLLRLVEKLPPPPTVPDVYPKFGVVQLRNVSVALYNMPTSSSSSVVPPSSTISFSWKDVEEDVKSKITSWKKNWDEWMDSYQTQAKTAGQGQNEQRQNLTTGVDERMREDIPVRTEEGLAAIGTSADLDNWAIEESSQITTSLASKTCVRALPFVNSSGSDVDVCDVTAKGEDTRMTMSHMQPLARFDVPQMVLDRLHRDTSNLLEVQNGIEQMDIAKVLEESLLNGIVEDVVLEGIRKQLTAGEEYVKDAWSKFKEDADTTINNWISVWKNVSSLASLREDRTKINGATRDEL